MSGSCGWFPLGPDQIRAWVVAHRDTLPQSLAELSRFPIPFRKAIVVALPMDRRIALWREHLERFLDPSIDLTEDQRALVRDAIVDLPRIFGGSPEVGNGRAHALEERMRRLITPAQAAAMFGCLGPPEPPEGLPLPSDAYGPVTS